MQLRAALGGEINAGGIVVTGEHEEWLRQLAADVEWYIKREHDLQLTPTDEGKVIHGCSQLVEWRSGKKLVQLLSPTAIAAMACE